MATNPEECQLIECTLPLEYCEYGPHPGKCRSFLKDNQPDLYKELYPNQQQESTDQSEELAQKLDDACIEEESKPSTDQPPVQQKQQKKIDHQKVVIKLAERGRKKCVTIISNLELFGIDLKATAKRCATKFACGSSVSEDPATGSSVVIVQGSVVQEAGEFMLALYPTILKSSNISFK